MTLAGKTLGLLGLGRVGKRMAEYAKAFGMDVIAWSQNLTEDTAASVGARQVEKAALFEAADVASIHLVLSERTRGLVGAPELAVMKPHAYLINTSRGRSSTRSRCSPRWNPGVSPAPGWTCTTSNRCPAIIRCGGCRM